MRSVTTLCRPCVLSHHHCATVHMWPNKAHNNMGTPMGCVVQVDPTRVANPGLILDAGIKDWTCYMCGIGVFTLDTVCPECVKDITRCLPSNLNEPSITIGRLTQTWTVVRTVTSVLDAPAKFSAAYSGSACLQVTITPSSFTLAPGERCAWSHR